MKIKAWDRHYFRAAVYQCRYDR